jgi:hypothetical protein
MTLVAGTVIDEARDLHPSFDPQTHPDKICLRFLSRWQKATLQRALTIYQGLIDGGLTIIPLPLVDFDAGEALADVMSLVDITVTVGLQTYPVTILPYHARFDPQPEFACWFVNGVLYLAGKPNDWTQASKLTVRYLEVPADLIDKTSPLVLPDHALSAAVHAIAGFIAGRGISRTQGVNADPAYFQGLAVEAEAAWLESLWLIDNATTHTIRDVM